MHRVEHARPDWVDAVGEVVQECVLGETPEAAGVDKPGVSRWCRKLLGERGVVLAGVGGASRDVDQARNARVDPGFGDYGACEGMTGQDHRPVVQRQNAARVRHVIGQRGKRVLHGGGGQPCALQPLDHLRPGRAVGVCAVNQPHAGLGGQRGHGMSSQCSFGCQRVCRAQGMTGRGDPRATGMWNLRGPVMA